MAGEAPQTYSPDKLYAVRFSRPVQVGPFRYLPRDTTLFRGAELIRIVQEHGTNVVSTADER